MDRLIPFLAAMVGLIALAGAVVVQLTADARTQRVAAEMAQLREDITALRQRTEGVAATAEQLSAPGDDGVVEAMLALQERMNKLEEEWAQKPTAVAAAAPTGDGGAYAPALGGTAAPVDPSWPTTDCIPLGTRFMASVGDKLPICKTPVVIKVSAITADNVMIDGTGVITETAFRPIAGSNCQLTVFSADEAGFAEMRVACQ